MTPWHLAIAVVMLAFGIAVIALGRYRDHAPGRSRSSSIATSSWKMALLLALLAVVTFVVIWAATAKEGLQ